MDFTGKLIVERTSSGERASVKEQGMVGICYEHMIQKLFFEQDSFVLENS
jgi:hypothetical protein